MSFPFHATSAGGRSYFKRQRKFGSKLSRIDASSGALLMHELRDAPGSLSLSGIDKLSLMHAVVPRAMGDNSVDA